LSETEVKDQPVVHDKFAAVNNHSMDHRAHFWLLFFEALDSQVLNAHEGERNRVEDGV
jgi:hypothetical protein